MIISKKLRIRVVKRLIRRYEILYKNEPVYGYNNKQQVYYELIEYWGEKLKILKHNCFPSKPLVSRYIGFNTRDIVYECKTCGNRKIIRLTLPFEKPFPIPTTSHITHKELEKYL
jgi:hypothetical protein